MRCGSTVGIRTKQSHIRTSSPDTELLINQTAEGYPSWLAATVPASTAHVVVLWPAPKATPGRSARPREVARPRAFLAPVAGYRIRLFAVPLVRALSHTSPLPTITAMNQQSRVVARVPRQAPEACPLGGVRRTILSPVGTPSTLETERLVLRSMVADDLDDLLAIFGDAGVMAAFRAAPLDRKQVGRWLERNLDHQREHGYGLFAVCLRANDRLIGDCGLELMEVSGEQVAELGYDFRRDYWNQGYATEAACAVRDFAFSVLRLPKLVSLIQPGNPASERVAQKTGLKRTERIERDGRTYLRYEIANMSSGVPASSESVDATPQCER
jgi:[ribosomal protein S5]-alanine N-acetyltransferase